MLMSWGFSLETKNVNVAMGSELEIRNITESYISAYMDIVLNMGFNSKPTTHLYDKRVFCNYEAIFHY